MQCKDIILSAQKTLIELGVAEEKIAVLDVKLFSETEVLQEVIAELRNELEGKE